jgi:hypothetical protein
MITGPDGRPVASAGNDSGRKISVVETNHNGRMVWAIEYHPSIQAFEFEEVLQVLGNAIQGIATNARARKHEALAQQKMQQGINNLNKE